MGVSKGSGAAGTLPGMPLWVPEKAKVKSKRGGCQCVLSIDNLGQPVVPRVTPTSIREVYPCMSQHEQNETRGIPLGIILGSMVMIGILGAALVNLHF